MANPIPFPFPREALAAAGHRFEQANGNRIQLSDFDLILAHKLRGTDPEKLAEAIQTSLVADAADAAYRQSAYFALGKKSDEGLIPFFNERLEIELASADLAACYQIMIALDNVDVEVFDSARDGYAANENDLNQRDAERYLRDLASR